MFRKQFSDHTFQKICATDVRKCDLRNRLSETIRQGADARLTMHHSSFIC